MFNSRAKSILFSILKAINFFSFGSWGNLKVLTLDFKLLVQFIATQNTMVFLRSSQWTWNQNSFKFPAFLQLANSDVIGFISDNFLHFRIRLKLQNMFILYLTP